MNPELVKFQLPTTDQFSVAVDSRDERQRLDYHAQLQGLGRTGTDVLGPSARTYGSVSVS
jgi:hypothetical protein